MEQEYADVDAPRGSRRHDHTIKSEVGARSLRRRGVAEGVAEGPSAIRRLDPVRLLGVLGAGVLVVAVLVWLVPTPSSGTGGEDGASDAVTTARPAPTGDVTPRLTPAQVSTAEVYAEWQLRVATADCSADEGYPYEAQVRQHVESVPVVADYLGVVPQPLDPRRPVPQLRQPDLYLNTYGTTYETVPGTANCRTSQVSLSSAEADAVNALIAQARSDEEFLATLAEQAWVSEHPAEVTHAFALLRVDRADPIAVDAEAQQYWSRVRDVVEGALGDQTVWVPTVRTVADGYAQTTGVLDSGSAVAVRVGRDDAQMGVGSYLTRVDDIRCADITVSAGVRMPWGTAGDLAHVIEALATTCNALINAGFVEAETLAEVYWD